ncbi:MAG: hypothetical protein HDR14_00075 [Lachnospiraceae bacterium]|nr:hypothetical protein [Lachnospiraceae bacterium]
MSKNRSRQHKFTLYLSDDEHRNLQRKCRRERNYAAHKGNTYYDDPKYNTAFERCIDIMSRLILKYGSGMLEELEREKRENVQKAHCEETNNVL